MKSVKNDIINIIAEYLDISPDELDEHKTLDDLQIDSLDFAEIMFEIEEKFDTSIMFEMQDQKNDIRNLGDALRLIEEQIVSQRAAGPVENNE
jgi:acyl carrier protein